MLALLLSAALAAPNVILISVDTLRADYLGCYGHEYNTPRHPYTQGLLRSIPKPYIEGAERDKGVAKISRVYSGNFECQIGCSQEQQIVR